MFWDVLGETQEYARKEKAVEKVDSQEYLNCPANVCRKLEERWSRGKSSKKTVT